MSVNQDPLSAWHKNVYNQIKQHRAEPLPESKKGMYGRSTFGFLTQTFNLPRIPTVGGMSLGLGPDMFDQAKRQLKGMATNWLIGGLFRKEEFSYVTGRVNQYLEENGYLRFIFGDDEFQLPFFENPKISSSRTSNYAEVPVMNRNEPWRIWTGASPEQVDISFDITLPHILQFAIKHAAVPYMYNFPSEEYEDAYRGKTLDAWAIQTFDYEKEEFKKYIDSREYTTPSVLHEAPSQRAHTDDYEMTKYVSYMVDLIRASVIGSSLKDYVAGPPIVKLQFGALYKEAPFIVKSYNFKFEGTEGYHNETMLPRRIKVRMSLESIHQNSDEVLPGWDSILHI